MRLASNNMRDLDLSSDDQYPLVAIVGRPNVGKSALFNRLTKSNTSLVEDLAGTTRDRIYRALEWRGRILRLVDTGGISTRRSERDPFAGLISDAVTGVIDQALVVLFVVDASTGLNPADSQIAERLRHRKESVILVMNKSEKKSSEYMEGEFFSLGLGSPIKISALHGKGGGDLLDQVLEMIPLNGEPEGVEQNSIPDESLVRLAIVGRPNVGKSSLTNAIVGEDRVIVSSIPGTTRDAIDTRFDFDGHRMLIVDTAVIRRRGRVERGVERHSVQRAEASMDRADVVVLLLSYEEILTAQDTHIAGYANENFKGMVIAVNKWDLATDRSNRAELVRSLDRRYRFLPWAPVMFVSAQTGEGVQDLLQLVVNAAMLRRKRIGTGEINRVIRGAIATHAPPMTGTKRLKVMYVTQAEISPPTFIFFVNDPDLVHFSYKRFLENQIRENFDYTGTAIRLIFRRRSADRFDEESEI